MNRNVRKLDVMRSRLRGTADQTLSRRDQFAMAALAGISAHPYGVTRLTGETVVHAHARWALAVADEMLEQSGK